VPTWCVGVGTGAGGRDAGGGGAPAPTSLLCPELIGRDAEAAALRARFDVLAFGRGGVVVVQGDAGAGKTRIVREAADAARAAGTPVLAGRAVPGAIAVPYRPLTEALLAAFRSTPVPDSPALAGFRSHLGRLVPQWRTDERTTGGDDSPLLLGEAVVRLLADVGSGRGCVLVLEDLHWADAETIAVVDYLADALAAEPVLCLCTVRPDGAAADLVARLERRAPGTTIRLRPLVDDDVDRMVAACLATAAAPAELGAFVRAHGDGNPFLVEELLAGLVASGELRRGDDGRWTTDGVLTPTVPASLRESNERRLARLDPVTRRVVGAAALLGRRFEWELLPGLAEVDGRTVVDALRAAVDEQLVEVEGSGFTFRHALTREAVLGDLLPPDRRHLAARAWPVVERAHPGLPGPVCELAAELAEAAGRPDAASERLVESARRALAAGALVTAESTARRACRLAPDDHAATEVLVRVLVAAGKPTDALALGSDLADRLAAAGARAEARTDLLVTLARAALTAGDTAAAARFAGDAAAVLAPVADPAPRAQVDAVAAHVALEQVRLDDAAALAHVALAAAEATGQPAVACEAMEVLGRVARGTDLPTSSAWFRRGADLAVRAGLPGWHLRAQQELAINEWPSGDPTQLLATRDLAARYGALVTVAVMELSLADIALSAFDRAACLEAATACHAASRRYGLATEAVAALWLAGAHALAGDDRAMDAAIECALAPDPDDPRILGDLHGRVLTTRAVVAGDLDALPGHLDAMARYVRVAPPTTSIFPGRALWATVHAIDDPDGGEGIRAELAAIADLLDMRLFRLAGDVVDAIVRGRAGDGATATALVTAAVDAGRGVRLSSGILHTQLILVARAALRDGWGEPAAWLREAEAFFAAGGHEHTARRCRALLAEAGAPVPRRGRGASKVPASLRALGVTSREVDVLALVTAGLSNKEIAARLYLSPKTVERHLSSLFDRTGVRSRGALTEVARTHGVEATG
jgi:DNA-binding NarL/FixJ family response regulator